LKAAGASWQSGSKVEFGLFRSADRAEPFLVALIAVEGLVYLRQRFACRSHGETMWPASLILRLSKLAPRWRTARWMMVEAKLLDILRAAGEDQ
jgi:hypothetical protein